MPRRLSLLILILALGVLVWLWTHWTAPAANPGTGVGPGKAGTTSIPLPSRGTPTEPHTPEPGAVRQSWPSHGRPSLISFHGVCVGDDGETPLAGVTLGLGLDLSELPVPMTGEPVMPPPPFTPPAPVRSDVDGSFSFHLPRPTAPLRLSADQDWVIENPQVHLDSMDPEREGGTSYDLGQIFLTKGFRVAGRVVDQDGAPVLGMFLGLDMARVWLVDGSFDFGPLTAAHYSPLLNEGSEQIVSPEWVKVGPEHDSLGVLIRANIRPRLRGLVLDAAGAPVADLQLSCDLPDGTSMDARTDSQGRFQIPARSMQPTQLRFTATTDPESELRLVSDGAWHSLPGPEVTLRARPWLQCRVKVSWASGGPVQNYVLAREDGDELALVGDLQAGEGLFRGLTEGNARVRVLLPDHGWVRSGLRQVHASEPSTGLPPTSQPITIADRAALRISVAAPPGLTQPFNLLYRAPTHFGDGKESTQGNLPKSETLWIHRGAVGGVVELNINDVRRRHVLTRQDLQRGKLHFDLTGESLVRPAQLFLTLKGRGEGIGPKEIGRFIRLRRAGAGALHGDAGLNYPGLLPGPWEVLFVVDHRDETRPDRSTRIRRAPQLLTRIDLKPGEERRLQLDLQRLGAGRIRGELRQEGRLLRGRELTLRSEDGLFRFRIRTDGSGRIRERAVLPGRYQLELRIPGELGIVDFRTQVFAESIEIEAGRETRVQLDATRERLELQITDLHGQPRTREWFRIWRYGPVRSDTQGRVILEPVPPGVLFIALPIAPGSDTTWVPIPVDARRGIRAEVRL